MHCVSPHYVLTCMLILLCVWRERGTTVLSKLRWGGLGGLHNPLLEPWLIVAGGNRLGGYGTAAGSVFSPRLITHTHSHTKPGREVDTWHGKVITLIFLFILTRIWGPVLIFLTTIPHFTHYIFLLSNRSSSTVEIRHTAVMISLQSPVSLFCCWPLGQLGVEGQHLSSWMFIDGKQSLMSRDNRRKRNRGKGMAAGLLTSQ